MLACLLCHFTSVWLFVTPWTVAHQAPLSMGFPRQKILEYLAIIHHVKARLDESHAGIKIAKRIINNLRYADDTTLMAEIEEELKSLLMIVKEESEKAGLKLNIQKTKIMASRPMTSWQTDGGKMETVTDFIFLVSKITTDGDCSHEIKRRFLEETL